MDSAERVLWYINFIATLVLLLRIVRWKLNHTYPFLFLYWMAQAVTDVVLFQIPARSQLYVNAYFLCRFLNLVLAVCVLQELYRNAFTEHPVLATFGRRSLLSVLGITAILAGLGVGLDSTVLPGQYWPVHRFMTLDRTLEFMILMFLLLISGFLVWFPVRVRRNAVVYITGFVVFYFSQSFGALMINLLPQKFSQPISLAMLGMALVCLLIWIFGLRPEHESANTVTGHRWNPAAAARLSLQLDEINAVLARFVRN